jgi:hypothetical protein
VSDWIEHNGGPQPVADDVWVEAQYSEMPWPATKTKFAARAEAQDWSRLSPYRILNQHLIDAARLEGIRLGLEAAARAVDFDYENSEFHTTGDDIRVLEADIQADIARGAKPPA